MLPQCFIERANIGTLNTQGVCGLVLSGAFVSHFDQNLTVSTFNPPL